MRPDVLQLFVFRGTDGVHGCGSALQSVFAPIHSCLQFRQMVRNTLGQDLEMLCGIVHLRSSVGQCTGGLTVDLTGTLPGGALSLFGLMNDVDKRVQLIVDEDLLDDAFIGCHPCVNTSSVKIAVNDAFGPFLEATQHTLIPVHLTDEN